MEFEAFGSVGQTIKIVFDSGRDAHDKSQVFDTDQFPTISTFPEASSNTVGEQFQPDPLALPSAKHRRN